MDVQWQPSFDVSTVHALWVIASGRRLIDSVLHERLQPIANEMEIQRSRSSMPLETYWQTMLSIAGNPTAIWSSEREWLEAGQLIDESRHRMRERFPRMLEELALRCGPLQGAWEARGPGLLYMLRHATEPDFLVPAATVILVQPVFGGDGIVHRFGSSVHMETLLTDAERQLPETLRLAWLLAQLNLGQAQYQQQVGGRVLADVARIALIPALLEAAEEVQLTELSPVTVRLALLHWQRLPEVELPVMTDRIIDWWGARRQCSSLGPTPATWHEGLSTLSSALGKRT